RRLRPGAAAQAARSDLARPDPARAQSQTLWWHGRDRPHGVALGLCPAALFSVAARRHLARHGIDLPGTALAGIHRPGARALGGPRGVARNGAGLSADAPLLSRLAVVGPGTAGHRGGLHDVYPAVCLRVLVRPRRNVERTRPGHAREHIDGHDMTDAAR